MNRRHLMAAAAGVALASPLVRATEVLLPTPRDYTGQYYPAGERHRTNNLIVAEPRGDVLHLSGQVVTPAGKPHAGVLVETWQADPLGRSAAADRQTVSLEAAAAGTFQAHMLVVV